MKRIFLITLIFTFSLQNLTNADNLKDFQIEGFSVGDKLSDRMSKEEIEENIVPYFQDQRKYYIVGKSYGLNQYDQIEFYIKSNDKINIFQKEKYYSELTFHYWYWKNLLDLNSDNWIGFCQKRRFWSNIKINKNKDLSSFNIKSNIIKI